MKRNRGKEQNAIAAIISSGGWAAAAHERFRLSQTRADCQVLAPRKALR